MVPTDEQRQMMERIESIFFTYAQKRRKRLLKRDLRLVHCTTAETGFKIIRSRTFWMRDTRGMADFGEVQHGYRLLKGYFDEGSHRTDFCAAVDKCHAGAGNEVLKRFDDWWVHIQSATYICCFSEHEPKTDSDHGRLSMWRAYGQKSGIAIVLRPPRIYSALPLNVFLSPVAYFSDKHLMREFDDVIYKIGHHHKLLKTLPRDNVIFFAYRALVMATVSVKHRAFREEHEWRLIHLPMEQPSQYVRHDTEILGGVPQLIYKVPLQNVPSAGITGISIPDLLERIIIGPTQYPGPIYAALVEELTKVGVADAGNKVTYSWIPLRT